MTVDVQHEPHRAGVAVDLTCGHRGCLTEPTEHVATVASLVTLLRAAGCLGLAMVSLATGQVAPLLAALAVHSIGDVADGVIARRRHEETRAGAVLDIVSDRLCIAVYYVAYGALHHDLLLPIGLFLFTFMVLDAHLSLSFLNWPLVSLNYFSTIDRTVYRWNWSPLAKVCNGGLITALMLMTESVVLCTVVALVLLVVKAASLGRLLSRGVPVPVGCAGAFLPHRITSAPDLGGTR